jgi:hypothetical protein
MKLTKTVLTGAGTAALAALLGTVLAPRAVHAAVAALVQITNTAANPVMALDIT